MNNIKDLKTFARYCETVIEDSNDLFLIAILASAISKEEFLIDVKKCLKKYYQWLTIAIIEEEYMICGEIWTAHRYEMEHYMKLARAIFKESLRKEIIDIDIKLKEFYLKYE